MEFQVWKKIILMLFVAPLAALAQNKQIDSTLTYCEQFEITAPDSAIDCYQNTLSLSQKNNYTYGIAQSKLLLGLVNSDMGEYAIALDFLQNSHDDFLKMDHPRGQASTLINTGNIYQKLGAGKEATENYLAAIELLKATDFRTILFMAYGNLASNLGMMGDNEKALYYNRQARAIAQELEDTLRMSFHWNTAGVLFKRLENLDSAKYAYHEAIAIGEHYDLTEVLQVGYNNLSEIFRMEGDSKNALRYAKMSLEKSEEWGDPYDLYQQKAFTAHEYFNNGYNDSAAVLFEEAVSGAEALGSYFVLEKTYKLYSDFLESTGYPEEALHFYKLANHYNDSVSGNEQKQYVSLLETRFRTAQKEETIARQELILARQNLYLTLSVIGGAALLIILLLVIRNYQHRKKLNSEKLIKLQQQNQIAQLRSLMEGEEKERARIGHDLHDSVGGLLGSVQLYLGSNGSDDNIKKAREIISATANEIRRISHNLMPEILLREGLEQAVSRFCNNITASGMVKVETAFINGPFNLDSEVQLFAFRAIQELLNNTLKYAQATEIFVQLSLDNQQLLVTVEDNGKGFGNQNMDEGTGLNNLAERTQKLGGHFDIQSSSEGVSVSFSIPAKKQTA